MTLTVTELLANVEPVVRGWIAEQIGDNAASNDPGDQFEFEFNNLTDGAIIYYDGYAYEWKNTTGTNVYGAGAGAGRKLAGGEYNVIVGNQAGATVVSSSYNTFVGASAGGGFLDSGGFIGHNTAIGYMAGGYHASSTYTSSVLVGSNAGRNLNSGHSNTFVGYGAGRDMQTRSNCIFIGLQAGAYQTASSYLLIIGSQTAFNAAEELTKTIIVGGMSNTTANQWMRINASLFMPEKAAALADVAGYGQIWVKDATPNELWWTDDAGNDMQLTFSGGVSPAPSDAQFVTLAVDATLANERVLTGTANQITVTDGGAGTTVTLSTPQDIHTGATPTFTGLYIGGSNQELRFYEGANYVGFEAPALAADQIWVLPDADGSASDFLQTDGAGNLTWAAGGGGGGAPTDAQYVTLAVDATLTVERVLTGTANQITITDNGAGSTVVLSTPQNIHTAATPTFGGIIIADGGTVGQAAGPLLTFNDTSNYLGLTGANFGVGTATPNSRLVVYGTDQSLSAGPHVRITASADAYPLMQILAYQHDSVHIYFDSYHDGQNRSSDAGSNFKITKYNDKLTFDYDSGVAAGTALSWNQGIVMTTSGYVGIGEIFTPTDMLVVRRDHNAATRYVVYNNTTGTTAGAGADFYVDGGNKGSFFAYSSAWSAQAHFANRCTFASHETNADGIDIRADGAASDIRFYAGGLAATNERMRLIAGGNFGIGLTVPTAKLHIDQASTTGAIPVLTLDQADIDLEFIKFIGSSEDSQADRSLVDAADMTTPGALVGWLQIYVEDIQGTNPITDSVYYVPFYAAPSA